MLRPVGILRPQLKKLPCVATCGCFTTAVKKLLCVATNGCFTTAVKKMLCAATGGCYDQKKRNNGTQHCLCAIAGILVHLVCRFSFQHLSCRQILLRKSAIAHRQPLGVIVRKKANISRLTNSPKNIA